MAKRKLTCVNFVKKDGEWVRREDMSEEEFWSIIEKTLEAGMKEIGFQRVKSS